MYSILILEIISIVSLIFGVSNIFLNYTSINLTFPIYLWTILIVILVGILEKRSKLYRGLLILEVLPILYFKESISLWFLIAIIVLIYIYIIKGLNKGQYGELTRRFKLSYMLIAIGALFGILSKEFRLNINSSIIFFVIYLLSSIVFIRSLRHIECGMDMRQIKRINIRYIIGISIFSVVVAIDNIRNTILFIIKNIYNKIIDIILFILYYPLKLILSILYKIFMKSSGLPMESIDLDGTVDLSTMEYYYEDIIPSELLVKIFNIIVGSLIFILLMYIGYKILRRVGDRKHNGIEYIEEREYINRSRKIKRIFIKRYPKEYIEQIRYYYRRYLDKLDKHDIDIKESDTSLDIQMKSIKNFRNVDKLREIYIKARYGNNEIKKEVVDEMKKVYKNL